MPDGVVVLDNSGTLEDGVEALLSLVRDALTTTAGARA